MFQAWVAQESRLRFQWDTEAQSGFGSNEQFTIDIGVHSVVGWRKVHFKIIELSAIGAPGGVQIKTFFSGLYQLLQFGNKTSPERFVCSQALEQYYWVWKLIAISNDNIGLSNKVWHKYHCRHFNVLQYFYWNYVQNCIQWLLQLNIFDNSIYRNNITKPSDFAKVLN